MTDIIDQNNASRTKFQVAFKRLPNVVFNCNRVTIPGLQLGGIGVPTPFSTMEFAGTTVDHSDFAMEFLLNETHTNYAEILNWIQGVGFPEDFAQYRELAEGDDGVYSDFTVTTLSNAGNPKVRYTFTGGFPKTLSELDLTFEEDEDGPVPVTASFGFTLFRHEVV
jgi:hypothetical protein